VYEQREAVIGCAAVVKSWIHLLILGDVLLPSGVGVDLSTIWREAAAKPESSV
jgi:hypothetical protein